MKISERNLLLAVYRGQYPYEVPGNAKQHAYYCQKWTRKGWYNYSVNVLCGWLETPGKEVAQQLLIEVPA